MSNTSSQDLIPQTDGVLLIGGAGYIGRHVAWQLYDVGIPIVILDNLSTGSRDYLPPCDFIEADIIRFDESELAHWVGRVRAVMHFAAKTSAPESMTHPAEYYRSNVIGTLRALELAHNQGASTFVFSSTAAVYGEPEFLPVTEDHPTRPGNPYGGSKLAAEMAVADFCRAHNIHGVSLRYFNVAGGDPNGRTGDMRESGGNLIHQLLCCLDRPESVFQVFGDDYDTPDGTARRDFVHVSDIAAAHVHVMERADELQATHTAFNIGYGRPYSVSEMIKTFETISGDRFSADIKVESRREGDISEIWADNARLQAIGWQPKHNRLEQILRDSVNWHSRK